MSRNPRVKKYNEMWQQKVMAELILSSSKLAEVPVALGTGKGPLEDAETLDCVSGNANIETNVCNIRQPPDKNVPQDLLSWALKKIV